MAALALWLSHFGAGYNRKGKKVPPLTPKALQDRLLP